jgi:hypothetical protein
MPVNIDRLFKPVITVYRKEETLAFSQISGGTTQ